MKKIRIQIILGSTREGRRGGRVASWVLSEAAKRPDLDAELVDLRDWPLPFYNEVKSPSALKGEYAEPLAKKWAEKIATADGYVFVTPEYNHGYPAVLKNAIDFLYSEWNKKPAGVVSYSNGTASGIRAVEQLRLVFVDLELVSVRAAVHIPTVDNALTEDGQPADVALSKKIGSLLDELTWWAQTLKAARDGQK